MDRTQLTLGETVRLDLRFEGVGPESVPEIYSPPNLRIDYVGQSTQLSIVNAQATASITYSYNVTPATVGGHTIPAIIVYLKGQKLQSQPITLSVAKGDPAAVATAEGPKLWFARILVPKQECYLGEMFTAELQLYAQNRREVMTPQLRSEGFILGRSHQLPETRVQIGLNVYGLIRIQMSLAATKTGKLTLGPAEWKLTAVLQSPDRRRADPFDPLGFFSRQELRQINVLSDTQTINVLPLPNENVPPGFSGAVGRFDLTATASPTNVTVGDPVTIRVRIAGRGAFDPVALPPADHWRDFKLYPPSSKVETTDPLGVEGVKHFEQVVIPQNAEVKSLPPLEFSYFDPDQRQYRTVTYPAIALSVRPGASAAQQPTVLASVQGTAGPTPPVRDILHIKTRPGTLAAVAPPLVQRPWFLVSQGLPPMLWFVTLIWRKRREALERNPRLLRQRRVAKVVQQGLRDLEQLAAANRADEFHATLFRLLQEELGQRLDLPASAITEAVLEEHVRPKRLLDDATVGLLHVLFQLCNQARYAPESTTQELASLIPRAKAALCGLQKMQSKA